MNKLIAALITAAFAAFAINAQAASHAGGAPMKASAPDAKASGAAKKEEKKEMKKEEKKS